MAIVTRKTLDVQVKDYVRVRDKGLFGYREHTETFLRMDKIHSYFVLTKDDNDTVLQSIIDSIQRKAIGIGTEFDDLARRAFQVQPESVSEQYVLGCKGVVNIEGMLYITVVFDDYLEIMPHRYWFCYYKRHEPKLCEKADMDNDKDITSEIKDYIERVKNTYTKYVSLYETRKEE
jgi:hypothetical protein